MQACSRCETYARATQHVIMPCERPDWGSYFMEIATIVAKRSTCLRRNVGAVIVKDRRILATGYNGAPIKLAHCLEIGCIRQAKNIGSGERHELCRGLHAEQNAIVQAAYHGVGIKSSWLYSTHLPCSICMKMILNAGIEEVFYLEGYPDDLSTHLIEESGIIIQKITKTKV